MLAIESPGGVFLIDCGGDVIQRCLMAGLDPARITGMLVTHEHPDHVAGFPLFMTKLYLHGRRNPIPVYGIESAVTQAEICFGCFDTESWENLTEIEWHVIEDLSVPILQTADFTLTGAFGTHGVQTIGVRIDALDGSFSVTYSGDTEPCDAITQLAKRSSLLIHEANGEGHGHTSVIEAAEVAKASGAEKLILVHLSDETSVDDLRAARDVFPNVALAEELMMLQG